MSDVKQITLSASGLRDLHFCDRKIWLDIHGNRLERDKTAMEQAIRFSNGIVHERQVHEATTTSITKVPVGTWREGVEITRSQIKEGVSGILGAYLEYEIVIDGVFVTVRGRPDRLRRVRLHNPAIDIYMPYEIKQKGNVSDADRLQLDCYVWLLTHLQGFRPPAEFWMGKQPDGRPRERIRHEYNHERLMNALKTVVQYHLQSVDEPEIFIDSRCNRCEWRTTCRSHAQASYDISLVHRLGSKEQNSLNQGGIFTLNQLIELSPQELKQFKHIKTRAERFLAHAQAWVEDQPIVYRDVPEICLGDAWHFDIEFDAQDAEKGVWSIGWNRNNELPQIVLVTPDRKPITMILPTGQTVFTVPDSDEAWRVFANAVSVDDALIFHWTSVEKTMIEKTAPDDVKSTLQHRISDLHKHCNDTVAFPIYSTSIKNIANYLGFHWSGYDFWFAAYQDYQRWLHTGEESYLIKTCAYQSDDVMAMAVVRQWMINNAS